MMNAAQIAAAAARHKELTGHWPADDGVGDCAICEGREQSVIEGLSVACSTPSVTGFGPLSRPRVRHELCVTGCACPCHETEETES